MGNCIMNVKVSGNTKCINICQFRGKSLKRKAVETAIHYLSNYYP